MSRKGFSAGTVALAAGAWACVACGAVPAADPASKPFPWHGWLDRVEVTYTGVVGGPFVADCVLDWSIFGGALASNLRSLTTTQHPAGAQIFVAVFSAAGDFPLDRTGATRDQMGVWLRSASAALAVARLYWRDET